MTIITRLLLVNQVVSWQHYYLGTLSHCFPQADKSQAKFLL